MKSRFFLATKWTNKDIDMGRLSDRIIVIEILVEGIVVSVISVFIPQSGSGDNTEWHLYDSLISVAVKFKDSKLLL